MFVGASLSWDNILVYRLDFQIESLSAVMDLLQVRPPSNSQQLSLGTYICVIFYRTSGVQALVPIPLDSCMNACMSACMHDDEDGMGTEEGGPRPQQQPWTNRLADPELTERLTWGETRPGTVRRAGFLGVVEELGGKKVNTE